MSERYPGGYITKSPPAPSKSSAKGVWTLEQVAENVKAGNWPPNGPFYIEDVFSTWLYNGSTADQTIINDINLSLFGGLVWIKQRSGTTNHALWGTVLNRALYSNDASTGAGNNTIATSSGFTVAGNDNLTNSNGLIYTSWTFRKQPKFFDVLTYTGNGGTQSIPHNLQSVPGCVIIKNSSNSNRNWVVWHRGLSSGNYIILNSNGPQTTSSAANVFGNNTTTVDPTSTVFTIGNDNTVNSNGDTYIAYIFAHNAGGFGLSGSDNVISCGSYTGNGLTAGPTITLGYEPQWILIKRATDSTADWYLFDNMRGMCCAAQTRDLWLLPNSSAAEATAPAFDSLDVLPTGFQIRTSNGDLNGAVNYIYIAIRRGPMKTPTDATKVFLPTVYTGTNVDNRLVNTTIAPDMVWMRQRNSTTVAGMVVGDRLRGQPYILTGSTNALVDDGDSFDKQLISAVEYGTAFSSMSGVWVGNDPTAQLNASTVADNQIVEAFKRAPGFFDVVYYEGKGGSSTTLNHNLGVVPELIIIKNFSNAGNFWPVYFGDPTDYLVLNTTAIPVDDATFWFDTAPTATQFTVGSAEAVNKNGNDYIAYLFATCPGVSKVGTYTGNGAINPGQDIDCGFTNGARFVLIKRTDSTGSWWVFDSARGIATGQEPYIALNSTAAEASDDILDPYNLGFTVNNKSPNDLNTLNATYIFLAIA